MGTAALEKATEGVATFEYEPFDLGAERYLRDGEILPDEDLERIKSTDAILLGAVGDPRIKAGILERGLLLKLRFALDQYVNLRPSKLYPGVESPLANPGEIDFVVVREGTEGLYCGAGGAIRRGTEHEVATEVSINTAYGVERVVRYAFELAMKRRKHVTLVHKKNVLVNAGDMWQNIVNKVAAEYPEVQHDYSHIDAATIYLVTDPSRFDVILTDNLFGDILTDEAGAVVGGVGYSASGCINASNEYPSMFERSTVLPPTSQARASRTRPPRSSPPPCCCVISDSTTPPRKSTPPWNSTSPKTAAGNAPPTKWAATSWLACRLWQRQADRFGHRKRRVNARQEKRTLCAATATKKLHSTTATVSRPTRARPRARTSPRRTFRRSTARSTSTELVEFGHFGLKPVAGLYATQISRKGLPSGRPFRIPGQVSVPKSAGRANQAAGKVRSLAISRARGQIGQRGWLLVGLFARAVAY